MPVPVLGTAALLLLAGLTTGLGYALVGGEGGKVGPIVGAALAQAPATLALAGLVVLAVVAVPRWASALARAARAFWLVLGQIGEVLELPQAVMDLSPFTHIPAAPAGDVTAGPLVALSAIALVLTAVSVALFRRATSPRSDERTVTNCGGRSRARSRRQGCVKGAVVMQRDQ